MNPLRNYLLQSFQWNLESDTVYLSDINVPPFGSVSASFFDYMITFKCLSLIHTFSEAYQGWGFSPSLWSLSTAEQMLLNLIIISTL